MEGSKTLVGNLPKNTANIERVRDNSETEQELLASEFNLEELGRLLNLLEDRLGSTLSEPYPGKEVAGADVTPIRSSRLARQLQDINGSLGSKMGYLSNIISRIQL